jgi:hypothetical protein
MPFMRSPVIDILTRLRFPWQLSARILLLCVLAGLAACGSTLVGAPTATPTVPPTVSPAVSPGTVLFQSDWSQGLAGSQASDGWTVRDGMLEIDGKDNRTLTIPYQPTARDYAVEFQVQVVNEPEDGGFFRLRAAPTPDASGFRAEVYRIQTPIPHINGDHPTAQVVLDPTDAQDPASVHPTDYEPHTTMRTYHVEVRENTVRFATDSSALSAAVSLKTKTLSHGPLTLECGLAFLRFGSVRIVAL